ncbi:D-alanyl-D-alanine carboxypeptidase [Acuticoccus mangrovi]|uniref:Serine hydrolase n=1 Tax=Acuticoccus mangrovi TaxID=2796142 RepID=A0A934IPQ5_9HYPH|nr:D-alanyl-D-alanine carboxypeptidase [Acuticoccus mangrovi]MBJ3776465.1 serine hydrolase [Acuticoccus mangrovi]
MHVPLRRNAWTRCSINLLAAVAVLACLVGPAAANPEYSGLVYDVIGEKTLYSSDADEARYPASLTKIMTLYITFEELKAGRLSLGDKLTVSAYAASRPPSKIGFKPGGVIAVRDAIKALVTKSANDVATALGENIAGSEAAFAKRMTKTAHRLGMKSTTFRNASGLPDPNQKTTARDMVRLGVAIQRDFPSYYGVFETRVFEYNKRRYGNHNHLLGRVEGVDGIKTGYIRASGFNLVTSVRRDGRHIVAAVFGGRTGASRDAQMRKLIEAYLPKATTGQAMVFAEWRDEGPPPVPGRKPNLRTLFASRLKAKTHGEDPIAETVLAFASEARAATAEPAITTPDLATGALRAVIDQAESRPTPLPAPAVADRDMAVVAVVEEGRPAHGAARFETAFAAFEVTPASLDADTLAAAIARSRSVPGTQTIVMGSAHRQKAPAPTAHAAVAGPWQIQIGAVPSAALAERLLAEAVADEPAMGQRKKLTIKVATDKGTLYRARFAGFASKDEAWAACKRFANHDRPCWAVSM